MIAQDRVWSDVISELETGQKRSHWMWFVFPQIAGLGRSAISQRYALPDLKAARDYLAHPVLGARLLEAVALLLQHETRRPDDILGSIDALKLCSCLTLFDCAAPDEPLFGEALRVFYDGTRDQRTLDLLGR